MSVINREDAIAKIKDIPYVQEHPNIGLLFEEWLNLMPDAEPTVFDGFFLCDKKPGACPSWESKGWTKCMNPYCHRTSRVDHALELPDDWWIPVEEKRLPEEEQDVLICNEIGDIQLTCGSYSTETDGWIWYTSGWRFGPAIAWRPLPPAFKPKEDK